MYLPGGTLLLVSVMNTRIKTAAAHVTTAVPAFLRPSHLELVWVLLVALVNVFFFAFGAVCCLHITPLFLLLSTTCYDLRLSLSKLLVNLSQVVKRTNTPLTPQQMASATDHGFLGRGFDPHHPQ